MSLWLPPRTGSGTAWVLRPAASWTCEWIYTAAPRILSPLS
jgi:hypothetical protein